tara:strand:+ start:2371 stop:2895 length:525 start_codon:yes stop_codon:yes gene_type:complete
MPLPDAKPTPNKANIYEQFSSIKVVDFTVDNLDVVRKPLFLNGQSEDVLRRLNLLSQVTNSQSTSGPIPSTLQIVTATGTSAANIIAFQPNAGEVWELTAASFSEVGAGSWRGILALKDTSGNYVELVDKASSGTGQSLDFVTPVYITSDVYLEFTIVTVDTSLSVKAAVVRVR